ncbi:MAG TPA: DNA double-strand break repair nuclease NurA, partial [Aggregatilineaceae bacterium]|nr:DNA double-strand break repair nuclease NurA [Aggregatilineaceae bacterium]
QVERMGRMIAARNVSMEERSNAAWEFFQQLHNLDAIRERIQLARHRDAGFRGAAPLHEVINRAYPLPSMPDRATVLAVDGSQIYPSIHTAALFYLINTGVFIYHHGLDDLPEQLTEPRLFYTEEFLRNAQGQVVTNAAVNARRSVTEIQVLAREAWRRRDFDCPMVAICDGPLLFWVGKEVPDGKQLQNEYIGAMVHLHDTHTALHDNHAQSASLVGYVDRPTSAFVISLIYLLSLTDDEVRGSVLESNGELEGLTDQPLMFKLLRPGERSALFVQQSPQNKRYHDKGPSYEIAFFYLNVGNSQGYHLARVEVPMWVARNARQIDHVHALLYHQCQMMWRYPYALTRADELAVIRAHEKTQLEEIIEIELRRNQQLVEQSEKLESKIVRSGRTRYLQPGPQQRS